MIVLNVNDARGNDTAIYKQLRQTLERYQPWLCSAPRGNGNNPPPLPLDLRPILILTGGGARGECFDNIPPEDRIYVFGSGNPDRPATNFNRWVNYSWSAVEPEGQSNTGEWTQQDRQRLETLVNNAHENGYWIRFYSLDGFTPLMTAIQGWSPEYNFGSKEQAAIRWRAAKEAGVDFIASDQYEEAAAVIQETAK